MVRDIEITWLERETVSTVHSMLVELQDGRAKAADRMEINDSAFLFEPRECFTILRDGNTEGIRDPAAFDSYRTEHTIPLVKLSRGGGMIWHGPGQIVLAPVVDLQRKRMAAEKYITCLEEACLATLRDFGVQGVTNHIARGTQGGWARDPADGVLKKLAFLGTKISRGIAIHGCAINVSCDLEAFSLIWPCGLKDIDARATSIKEITGETPSVHKVGAMLASNFIQIFRDK